MVGHITRKFLEVLLFFLFITFISFVIVRFAPGDPVLTILNVDELSVSQEQVETIREDLGFNEPLIKQYGLWLLKMVQLDFGNSYVTHQPVIESIGIGLPATIELTVGALLVMLVIAIPLGSLSALYQGSWIDQMSRILAILGAAIPSFWLGLILIDVFAARLNWFPTMGREGLSSLVLPSLTLGLAIASVYVRLLRSSLLESLSQEFIRAARARGLSEWRIFFHHAFRHSLPPVISVFGVSFGSLVGGVVVIEVLFAYPGIGKLVIDAIRQRDYPVIQGYILLMAMLVLIVNTSVDVVNRLLRPEMSVKGREDQ